MIDGEGLTGPGAVSKNDAATNRPRKWWIAAFWTLISPPTAYIYVGSSAWAAAGYLGILVSVIFFLLAGFYARLYGVLAVMLTSLIYTAIPVFIALAQRRQYRLRECNSVRWYIGTLAVSVFILGFYQVTKDRTIGLHMYRISSRSMENTLSVGDLVLADLRAYDKAPPARGDLVVYRNPQQPATCYVKRVAGLPGDTLHIKYKLLYVNGKMVNPPSTATYEDPQRIFPAEMSPRDNLGPIVLQPEMYFVLGDNRDNSLDSRFAGPIPGALIEGKAVLALLSERGTIAQLDKIGRSLVRRKT